MKTYIFLLLLTFAFSSNLDYCINKYYTPILKAGLIFKGNYSWGHCVGCISGFVGYGAQQDYCKCYPVEYIRQWNSDPLCVIDKDTGYCWNKN